MEYYPPVFLVVASMASILNLVGVSRTPIHFSWMLFMGEVALVVIQAIMGRIAQMA